MAWIKPICLIIFIAMAIVVVGVSGCSPSNGRENRTSDAEMSLHATNIPSEAEIISALTNAQENAELYRAMTNSPAGAEVIRAFTSTQDWAELYRDFTNTPAGAGFPPTITNNPLFRYNDCSI
jgi:hypothetical protein